MGGSSSRKGVSPQSSVIDRAYRTQYRKSCSIRLMQVYALATDHVAWLDPNK